MKTTRATDGEGRARRRGRGREKAREIQRGSREGGGLLRASYWARASVGQAHGHRQEGDGEDK
eukprot:3841368-Pleurochrysis_carterae.AAC.2